MGNARSKLLALSTERVFLSVGVTSFAGYIIFNMYAAGSPVNIWAQAIITLCLLLGILSHYIYTLGKILVVQKTITTKLKWFLSVLILGHFAAWLYTLLISPRFSTAPTPVVPTTRKKRRSITSKVIHARIFHPITSRFKILTSKKSKSPDKD